MMNRIVMLIALVIGVQAPLALAGAGFKGEKFEKVFYLEAGGVGLESGLGAKNAKDFVSSDLMAIDAGSVIEKAFMIIDTPIVGLNSIEVGDDDDSDGFIVNASVNRAVAGMYGWAAGASGAYLELQGVIGADVYVAGQAKYYSAAGKEVKLLVSGTASAGKARVVIQGYKAAY